MQYIKSTKTFKLNQSILTKIQNKYSCQLPFIVNKRILLCFRCHENAFRETFTAQAFFNNMEVSEVPEPIKELSNVEAQMLSQVRPFMKIYNLCKGRGQYAVKGAIVHFPTAIKDVCLQLPLTAEEAGIIIVNESTESIGTCRELEVRPSILYSALEWLKENNSLYRNAATSSREHVLVQNVEQIACETNISAESRVPFTSINNYQPINGNRMILRANFHQSSEIFPNDKAGRQCTVSLWHLLLTHVCSRLRHGTQKC
jgi:hypothetical protein